MKAKVAHVLKTYGRSALLFHSAVFVTTFSGAYAAIRNGVDLRETLNCVPFVDLSKMDPEAGTLALAYVSTIATGKRADDDLKDAAVLSACLLLLVAADIDGHICVIPIVYVMSAGPARGALTITAVPFLARLFSRNARRVAK